MKTKKFISVIMTVLIAISIMCDTNITADAATTTQTVKASHLKTIFEVKDYKYDGYNSTNIGGISVGTANNRLFVIKSNSKEEISTLYYYNNIYNEAFKTGDKEPKRIVFIDGLLGHANAMAVDDDYLYVTMWQNKSGGEKSSIIQISRKAISLLTSGSTVSKNKKTVTDSDGNKIAIYKIFEPQYTSGSAYTRSITAITRYSYNKTEGITKFIINYSYSSDRTTLKYTIATLQDGKFTVSTSKDDMFIVENPNADVTMQDIFYDPSYGMLIPTWAGDVTNYVLCVNIKALKTQGKTSVLTFEPYKVLKVKKSTYSGDDLKKYEMESIAFVKRNEDKETIDFRLIFSCNKATTGDVGCDSIEEITPLSTYLTKL